VDLFTSFNGASENQSPSAVPPVVAAAHPLESGNSKVLKYAGRVNEDPRNPLSALTESTAPATGKPESHAYSCLAVTILWS
jgi:hypothetical protein